MTATYDLEKRIRDDIVRSAQRCGMDTDGKTCREVVEEMSQQIVNYQAELFDARAQLAAFTETIKRLRGMLDTAQAGGE